MMKGFRLQVIGYSLLFFLLSTVTCTLYPTYAIDSTPSAEIKAKLEELKREIASKAAKIKQEVNRKLQNKAYVGKVKSKTANSLTLISRNAPKTVSVNQDTVFENKIKSKQKFSPSTISEEYYIAGLGDVDETGVLTAKKVILLPTPTSESKTFLWGQIIAISDDNLVTLKDKNSKSVAATLPNSKGQVGNFVILTGLMGKNDIFEAKFVYVIPQSGILKPKKIATPSAHPKTSATSFSASVKSLTVSTPLQ